MLAYLLLLGETFAELAAGFGVGTATAWRYVSETVALHPSADCVNPPATLSWLARQPFSRAYALPAPVT